MKPTEHLTFAKQISTTVTTGSSAVLVGGAPVAVVIIALLLAAMIGVVWLRVELDSRLA